MLRQAGFLLALALVVAWSGLPAFLHHTLVPPLLPTSYTSLSSTAGPVESFTVHAPSLEYCEAATEWGHSVLVSCDSGRSAWNTVMGPLANPNPRGSLWVVDPSAEELTARRLDLLNFPSTSDFHPLGVEVLGDRLLVVNHQRSASTIEVFTLTPAKATHLLTLRHPSFTGAPNSVAIVSPTSFYLTHDHRYTRRDSSILGKILNFVETIGALPLSKVDFVSFTETGEMEVKTVARGVAFANGAALSHNKNTLAVASTTRRQIILFERNQSTNELTERDRIHLPFLVDNLSVGPRGYFSPFTMEEKAIRGSLQATRHTFPSFSLLATSPSPPLLLILHPGSSPLLLGPMMLL